MCVDIYYDLLILDDLSCYVDRCFACFEAKLGNRFYEKAETSTDEIEEFTARMENLEAKMCSLSDQVKVSKQHMESGGVVTNAREEFDEKIRKKLDIFMKVNLNFYSVTFKIIDGKRLGSDNRQE